MATAAAAQLEITRPTPETLLIRLAGPWVLRRDLPDLVDAVERQAPRGTVRRIAVDATGLESWDSMLIAELRRLKTICAAGGVEIDLADLPDGAQRLIDLATATPERPPSRRSRGRDGFRVAGGAEAIRAGGSAGEMVAFRCDTIQALLVA